MKKLVFYILTFAIAILMCGLISTLMNYNIFDINDFGFQFLYFSIVGCIVFWALQKMRLFDTAAISIFLALIFAYLLSRTDLIKPFGGFINLVIYSSALFLVFTLIFKGLWFNNAGYLRNIVFSLAAAFGYTAVHAVAHLLLKMDLPGSIMLRYFTNGFLIMITLSFAFSISELIITKIDPIFFQQPGTPDDEDDEIDDLE